MLQNEIARQYAENQLQKSRVSVRTIRWILQLYLGQKRSSEEYQALVKVRDYPNYLWGEETLRCIINRGILTNNSLRNQIIDFYKNGEYSRLKQELRKTSYETEAPIWIVTHTKELESDTVYPLIASMGIGKMCIALVINEIN